MGHAQVYPLLIWLQDQSLLACQLSLDEMGVLFELPTIGSGDKVCFFSLGQFHGFEALRTPRMISNGSNLIKHQTLGSGFSWYVVFLVKGCNS